MCTKNLLDEILQRIAVEAKRIFGTKLSSVVLFGSYARGDFEEESDIDVLLLVDMPCEELAKYRADVDLLCGDLLLEYGVVISAIEKDLKTYNRYSRVLPFYKNIEKDGVRIA